MNKIHCEVCSRYLEPLESRYIRSNMRRFKDQSFEVWRCSNCGSLNCPTVSNLDQYYEDYPLRKQVDFDYFNDHWLRVILKRLVNSGLQPHHKILDFGCGSGLLVDFLITKGFTKTYGYDPYVQKFNTPDILKEKYDWIISMDVIEHVQSPRLQIQEFAKMLTHEGHLCLNTPRAEGIDLNRPDEFLHQLHTPCHLHLLSEKALVEIAGTEGLVPHAVSRRWYQDSWMPLTSRKFIEGLLKAQGNDIDAAFERPPLHLFLTKPSLLFYAFFGYFAGDHKADYMMYVFKKRSKMSSKG